MSTIPGAVWRTIAERPDQLAVVDGDQRVTYAELGAMIDASAAAAARAGLGRGDRFAVWAPNSLGWIVAALGCQSVGAALVPVNTRWKGAEAADIIRRARVRVLFTTVGFLGTDPVAMLADEPLPDLDQIVLLPGSDPASGALPWHEWARESSTSAGKVGPDDPSDILFTSGTTGRPKGVVMTHSQTVRQFNDWCDFATLEPGDRYLVVNPFFHMFGYKAGWVAALMRGATVYPVPVFDVDAVLGLVERERITVLPGAPTIYRSILDHPRRRDYDLSSLRVAVTGAADIPVSLIEEVRAELPFRVVLTGYGLTEAGTVTGTKPDDDAHTIATTAGRAMPDLDVAVVDGELLVRGFSVMQGYLDDPEATAAAIDADGFLHTGDLAEIDDRGYVRIVGRLKDMLIVGGFNVYPVEVEHALLEHPAIAQVAVVGAPDARMGEVALAFVVPAADATPDSAGIIAWSRDRLANYKVPRHVEFVTELPFNAAGKVVKDGLRARAAELISKGTA